MDATAAIEAWDLFFASRKRSSKRDIFALASAKRTISLGFPPIVDMRHFSRLVGLEVGVIASQAASPDNFYRSYQLPKRRGGFRTIEAPIPTLAQSQRWIYDNILSRIAPHDCAHGFVPKRSVITNASLHLGSDSLLKLDIQNFFPSINIRRGLRVFMRCGYTPEVSYLLASHCFIQDSLPQGASTSPALSNIVTKRLDARLSGYAVSENLIYTRYADDICLSGKSIPSSTFMAVERIINDEGFALNKQKTRLSNRGQKKIITGLSISSGRLKLPRTSVRALKNDCHFVLKFGMDERFQESCGSDPVYLERLLGRLNFWLQIEPDNNFALEMRERLRERSRASLGSETLPLETVIDSAPIAAPSSL